MFSVELYGRVRHACHVEGLSQREAARRFGIHRNTVRKMLAFSVPPGYRRTKPPPRPKLDAFTAIIDQILAADRAAPPKQRHTAKRIYERLRAEHGFAGGYTTVKDYVRERRARAREVFVPLAHPPGHAQADFGEAVAVIGGVRQKIHFFCLDLPHSDAGFVKAYPAERTEAFLDGHNAAFAFLGGVPQLDPLRQHQAGGGPHPGRRHAPADARLRRAAVALPVPRPLRPARQGQRQGQGRGPGRLCPAQLPGADPGRRRASPSSTRISSSAASSGWIDRLRGHAESIGERLERDLAALQPRPPAPYDACDRRPARVSSLSLVRYDRNDYSVPTAYGHRPVLVRGYVEEVVIACGAEIIARHPRSYAREDFIFDPLHYLALLEQKTGALDQAAPLQGWDLPEAFATLRRLLEARMGKAGKREYVQVLRLLETFRLEDVHAAVREALRLGAIGFDAVKHLVLCRIERRPPKLDLTLYPYLPRVAVATTSAKAYMALLGGAA